MSKLNIKDSALLNKLKGDILRVAFKAQEGHIPSSISILEPVMAAHDILDLTDDGTDSLVLSKGHGSLALYVVLAHLGTISEDELNTFCLPGGILGGHPDSTKIKGVVNSSGSLGHGLPFAAGVAYAKLNLSPKNEGRVLCIVGDGELNEGSNWEAAMLAAHHNLKNLMVWVDYNHSGDRAVRLDNLEDKWASFGFEVEVVDSHDLAKVKTSLERRAKVPRVVIGNSIKGSGISFMENNPAWHHGKLDALHLELALKELI